MRRHALLAVAVMGLILATFLAAQGLGIDWLEDPRPAFARMGPLAPWLSFGLLVADVVLPVPSSLLMVANGALLGVLWGTLLSTAGAVGAALLAFGLGRRSRAFVARFAGEEEQRAVSRLLERWGGLAVIVTRPIPILAETSALVAGTTRMSWTRFGLAALAGALPISAIYAVAGAHARETPSAAVFLAVIGAAGLFWLIGTRLPRRPTA